MPARAQIAMWLLFSALVWGSVRAQMPSLYFSEDGNANGLWTFDTMTGTGVNIGQTGTTSSTIGLAASDMTSLLYGSSPWTIHHIQASGSGFVDVGGVTAEALTYVPGTNTLYGCLNGTCYRIDPATGASTGNLAAPPGDIEGMAYDGGEQIFCCLRLQPGWYIYNITADSWTLVGNLPFSPLDPGLAYDPGLGICYLKQSGDTMLYSVDPATATVTPVGDTGVSRGGGLAFVGLGIPPPTCVLTAPAGPVVGDADLTLDTQSMSAAMVDVDFEYSLDGGSTWTPCLASVTSPLANPAQGVATGMAWFQWDTVGDGVGGAAIAMGVLTHALVSDGVFPSSVECRSAPFDVDNTALCTMICGDCNMNGTGPDILDALEGAQIAAGLIMPSMVQMGCCDVDSSLTIDVLDALGMARDAAGLPVTLVCP